MTVLTDKSEVGRIDAALLAEELAEIYSTTFKGLPELKKVRNLYLIDCVFDTLAGVLYLYPGLWTYKICLKRKYLKGNIKLCGL